MKSGEGCFFARLFCVVLLKGIPSCGDEKFGRFLTQFPSCFCWYVNDVLGFRTIG